MMINSDVLYTTLLLLYFAASVSSSSYEICPLSEPQRFLINPDSYGREQCGVSPAPLKVIDWTEHHGACLAACAEFQGCSSYNYHYNTHGCELFCMPTEYSYIPNCIHYWVRKISRNAIVMHKLWLSMNLQTA